MVRGNHLIYCTFSCRYELYFHNQYDKQQYGWGLLLCSMYTVKPIGSERLALGYFVLIIAKDVIQVDFHLSNRSFPGSVVCSPLLIPNILFGGPPTFYHVFEKAQGTAVLTKRDGGVRMETAN